MEKGVLAVLLVLTGLKVEEDEGLEGRLLWVLELLHEALVLAHVDSGGAGRAVLAEALVRTGPRAVDAATGGTTLYAVAGGGPSPSPILC